MERLFGTDGMRGRAGEFPLDVPSLGALGRALVKRLEREGLPPVILIGRDTRESGAWMERALDGGIRSVGGKPVSAGVIPTSAVSFLTLEHGFSAGIVISASHNPYRDNGIKIFSRKGMKIPEEWEMDLERAIRSDGRDISLTDRPVSADRKMARDYIEYLKSRFLPGSFPRSFKIVIDCSNGAASDFAGKVFKDLGAEVLSIHDRPDGININVDSGSLHPEKLAATVERTGADLGVAYDGDADRALWVDETGRILNGDHTLFVLAGWMREQGRLKSNLVVATPMSNLGLEQAFDAMGLTLHRAQVGDKYVLEDMLRLGANLGGEQSGHTILLDDCPTGDGLLTSLKMCEVLAATGATLSELISGYREFPQILLNVPVTRRETFDNFPDITHALASAQEELGRAGRINLRFSGTEMLARVMAEGRDPDVIQRCARRVADAVTRHLGR